MAGRVGRIAAATAMVAATGTGTAMIGAGTANAASNPLIVGSCDSMVKARPGQAIKVDPSGLLGQAVAPIYLGNAPGGGTSTLSIPTTKLIQTVNHLPLLGGLLSQVTGVIGSSCDVTVRVVNAVHQPVADSGVGQATRGTGNSVSGVTKPLGSTVDKTTRGLLNNPASPDTPPHQGNPPTHNPGGGNAGGGGGGPQGGPGNQSGVPQYNLPPLQQLVPISSFGPFGNVFGPGARYGNLPFVTTGVFTPGNATFGQQVPGFSPRFGSLGQQDDGVQNAGQAEAYGSGAGNDVGLPLLIAVLALSGVGASLVRTWVLRRAAA